MRYGEASVKLRLPMLKWVELPSTTGYRIELNRLRSVHEHSVASRFTGKNHRSDGMMQEVAWQKQARTNGESSTVDATVGVTGIVGSVLC